MTSTRRPNVRTRYDLPRNDPLGVLSRAIHVSRRTRTQDPSPPSASTAADDPPAATQGHPPSTASATTAQRSHCPDRPGNWRKSPSTRMPAAHRRPGATSPARYSGPTPSAAPASAPSAAPTAPSAQPTEHGSCGDDPQSLAKDLQP